VRGVCLKCSKRVCLREGCVRAYVLFCVSVEATPRSCLKTVAIVTEFTGVGRFCKVHELVVL